MDKELTIFHIQICKELDFERLRFSRHSRVSVQEGLGSDHLEGGQNLYVTALFALVFV